MVGTQWGDEGKGKVVDLLTENVDAVIRFQGGHNAGHTLVVEGHGGFKRFLQVSCTNMLIAILVMVLFCPKRFDQGNPVA